MSIVSAMTDNDRPPKRIIANPAKRRAWVIYQLAIRGRSVAAIGQQAGVVRQTIYRVWDRPYPRMERLLADALDMRPQDLFPERYDADGLPNRKPGRRRRNSASKKAQMRPARHVGEQEAA